MTYAERPGDTHTDGTPLFQTPSDRANEEKVAGVIGEQWRCELRPFGMLAPLDFYATRHGRMVGLIEVKCRTHEAAKFGTVFLNVRKWLALGLGQVGMGVPSIFVVSFSDDLRFIPWTKIDATAISIAGCAGVVKSHSDVEPVILVPVASMDPVL